MVEILGGNLEVAIKELGINATKTYQGKENEKHPYQEVHQVWELENVDYEKICNIPDDKWKDDWGWWRSAIGSNMCNPIRTIRVNDKEIEGWYDEDRFNEYVKDFLEDIMKCDPDSNEEEERQKLIDEYFEDELRYENLIQYFCDEHGVSQPRNVCALAVDLAKINSMKLSELFEKFQG